jgi:hypothetical protein
LTDDRVLDTLTGKEAHVLAVKRAHLVVRATR